MSKNKSNASDLFRQIALVRTLMRYEVLPWRIEAYKNKIAQLEAELEAIKKEQVSCVD